MGSSNAKLKSDEYSTGEQPTTSTSAILYRTSIYGWGRLKYPIKTTCNLQRKNGIKKHLTPNNSATSTPTNHQQFKTKINNEQIHTVPTEKQSRQALIDNNGTNSTQVKLSPASKHSTINTPLSPTSKLVIHDTPQKKAVSVSGKFTPHASGRVLSHPDSKNLFKDKTPSFYGQYRCGNCSKYWRSPHSKEGIFQNCTKCGTPTIPKR